MSGRLDDEKLETLRRWGAGIAADGRDELRAAGKAILILVEEIERLQVDVWHARRTGAGPDSDSSATFERFPEVPAGASLESVAEEFLAAGAAAQPGLEPTLRGRVGRLLRGRAPESH